MHVLYMYMRIYVHMHVYMCACTYVYIYIYMHVCTRMYSYMYVYDCVYVCAWNRGVVSSHACMGQSRKSRSVSQFYINLYKIWYTLQATRAHVKNIAPKCIHRH